MAFLKKKLTVKSLSGKLSSKLGKLGGSLKSFADKLGDAASSIISKATSTLSGAFGVGGIKEGMKSLTSGLSGQGLVQLTSGAAGNLLTSITGGAGDIAKITGGAASSGFNFAFSGGSGASAIASMMGAAQSTLSSLTSSIIPGGLSAITGKIGASLSKITGILPNNIISTITGSASGIISGAAGDIFKTLDEATNLGIGQPLKDIVEGATNRIGGPIDILVNNQGALKGLDKFNLVGLIDAGKIGEAAKLINSKMKNSKDLLSSLEALGNLDIASLTAAGKKALAAKLDLDPDLRAAYIEKELGLIEIDVTSAVASPDLIEAMGDATTPIITVGSSAEGWNGDDTSDDYEFSTVRTYKELHSEFSSMGRDITEVIVNWTDTFLSDNTNDVPAKDVFKEIQSRKNNSYFHYLIMEDGSISRMAPIGIETNHTSFGGWKAKKDVISIDNQDSHNKYSIGIAFVGGINHFGVDYVKDFTRYRSAESYSPAQRQTFNKFMEQYYLVWPGGQAWGLNELATDQEAPGFNVSDYAFAINIKTNTQTSDEEALSSKDLKAKMLTNKIKEQTYGQNV